MNASRDPSPSREIEPIRAAAPSRRGFILTALAVAIVTFIALAACVPRGDSQEVMLPPDDVAGLSGDPLAGRTFEMIAVVPRDRIAAIINPRLQTPAEGGGRIAPDEPVIGLSINGDARAYSTYQLSRHEIVNDVVGGVPIAVTW